jgi:hypothetical protein
MVGNAYTILNSLHMTYRTSIRMETTDGIRDDTKRTGDLLSQAIGILGLEAKTSLTNIREGDGATVVPFASFGGREGLQDSVINKKRAGIIKHPFSILRTNVKSYYSKPTLTRNISSQALNNLELYKNAYDLIKSKPGNMTPGADGQTLDGLSIKKLTKLRDAVIN